MCIALTSMVLQHVLNSTGLLLKLEGRSRPVWRPLVKLCWGMLPAEVLCSRMPDSPGVADNICPPGVSLGRQVTPSPCSRIIITSSEETAAHPLPFPTVPVLPCHGGCTLCCSMQGLDFEFDLLKILPCKIGLGVHFLLCAVPKSKCHFVFLYCHCTTYVFQTASKGKSCLAVSQKCMAVLSRILTEPEGKVPVPSVLCLRQPRIQA